MKRTLSLLLALVLLFSLCGCGSSPAPSDKTQTADSTTAPTTDNASPAENEEIEDDLSDAAAKKAITAFFDGWKSGDQKALEAELYSKEAATELADAVKLTDYTLTPQEGSETGEYRRYFVHLNVETSALPRIPAGESEWVVWYGHKHDGAGMYLCPVGEDIRDRFSYNWIGGWTPTYFCYRFSTELEVFNTLNMKSLSEQTMLDWDEKLMTLRYWSLEKTTNREYHHATLQEMAAFVKTTFGIGGVDFTKSQKYDKDTNVLFLEGSGGASTYAAPVSYTEKNDVITVEIRYHADALCLLEAATMRYQVKRDGLDYRLISCEKVSGDRRVLFSYM